MEILKMHPEDMDRRTSYKIMNSNEACKMSDAEGSVLDVKAWVIYNDTDEKTGEIKKVVSLMTDDGEIFGTISGTFIREFEKIADHCGNHCGSIKVISGTSKAGRTYITCDIA